MTAFAWVLGAIFGAYLLYAIGCAIWSEDARELRRLDGWARPWQFVGLLALAMTAIWAVLVGLAAVIEGVI